MAYTTNHTMLQQMREGREESWVAFREFYKPLIARRGMDFHLTPNEIDALIQDVVLACFQEHVLENYDRSKGRFRDYLRTVSTRNALRIIAGRTNSRVFTQIDENQVELQEDAEKAAREWQEFLVDKALQELKETMDTIKYMAFEMYELQGNDAETVAKRLGLTTNQVYLIRTRTVRKLQDIIARLEREID